MGASVLIPKRARKVLVSHFFPLPGRACCNAGRPASHHYMCLAATLSDAFSVYVSDWWGRGLSGQHGDHYSMDRECEDVDARGLASLLSVVRAMDAVGLQTRSDVVFGGAAGITYLAMGSRCSEVTYKGPGGHGFRDLGTPTAPSDLL